jgi:hypothetical protein
MASHALDFGLTQGAPRIAAVWVRGELPASGMLWAANHHSWWDGFEAAAVVREERRPAALLIRIAVLPSRQRPAGSDIGVELTPRRTYTAVCAAEGR